MNLLEHEFSFDSTTVHYKFKPADKDCTHLIVIFSGFGWPKCITYNFEGESLQDCRSNILWIKDEFDGESTYYLCKGMSFTVEHSVIALIESTLEKLQLNRRQCTLLGASKGGSAALYFGIKYDFKNIISCVPQIKIGSYSISNDWPNTGTHMMGEVTEQRITLLDQLIPTLLKNDGHSDRNIYLISSPADIQYKNEIEPFLEYFGKYQNFNFIFTRSSLVWQHNMVTRYNLPIIMSILYANGEGAAPRFGRVMNGSMDAEHADKDIHFANIRKRKIAVSDIKKISFRDNLFFPEGEAFIKGFSCEEYGQLRKDLILEGKSGVYIFPLGSTIDKNISYRHFDRYFCDYQAGGFASLKHDGIDFSSLQDGSYSVQIELETQGVVIRAPATTKRPLDQRSLVNSNEVRIFGGETGLRITMRSVIGEYSSASVFRVEKKWRKENLLHYEGVFAVKGIELKNWSDAHYYLVLKSEKFVVPFNIGKCHRPQLDDEIGKGMASYCKGYFSTFKFAGIDLKNTPSGTYKVLISLSHKGSLFTQDTGDELTIDI